MLLLFYHYIKCTNSVCDTGKKTFAPINSNLSHSYVQQTLCQNKQQFSHAYINTNIYSLNDNINGLIRRKIIFCTKKVRFKTAYKMIQKLICYVKCLYFTCIKKNKICSYKYQLYKIIEKSVRFYYTLIYKQNKS